LVTAQRHHIRQMIKGIVRGNSYAHRFRQRKIGRITLNKTSLALIDESGVIAPGVYQYRLREIQANNPVPVP